MSDQGKAESSKAAPPRPDTKAPTVTVTRPSKPPIKSKTEEVPHQILSDLADSSEDQAGNSDSDSEKINTALQRPAGETIVAESSSDSESEVGGGGDESESEVPQTEDDDRKRAESSETESEDGPDIDTSRDVTDRQQVIESFRESWWMRHRAHDDC